MVGEEVAAESLTGRGLVRAGGSRGLTVEPATLGCDCPALAGGSGVVAAVVALGRNENGRSGALLLAPSLPSSLPRPKKMFLSVGLGGETARTVGSDTTTIGRGVNPAVLVGVNASSSRLVSSSRSLVVPR